MTAARGMVVRGMLAVLCGVLVAAVVDGLFLTLAFSGGAFGTPGRFVSAWFATAAAGAVATLPGWLLGSIVVLPVVTHRAGRGRRAGNAGYRLSAAAIGAVSMAPTILFLGSSDPAFLVVMFVCGAIGGLCMAAVWKAMILDRLPVPASPAALSLSPALPHKGAGRSKDISRG